MCFLNTNVQNTLFLKDLGITPRELGIGYSSENVCVAPATTKEISAKQIEGNTECVVVPGSVREICENAFADC